MIRKILAALVFVVLAVTVVGGVHYYIGQRLISEPAWPGWFAIPMIVFIAGGVLSLIFQAFMRRRLGIFLAGLAWSSYVWMGVLYYAVLLTFASDLLLGVLGFAIPDTSWAEGLALPRTRAAIVTAATAAFTIAALRCGLESPSSPHVPIRLNGLHTDLDGFRIVQISDIHIGPLLDRRFAAEVTARVNALQPDLVAVTGDVVDGRVGRLTAEVEPFDALEARHGVWFVTGNHDFYSGADLWEERFRELGWKSLRNAHVTITRGDGAFELAGVDDAHGSLLDPGAKEDLTRALDGCDPDLPIVLLAHDPSTFKRALRRDVDLQISGHTHGGQIWPFHWAVRLAIPWVRGLHQVGACQLYVSCGTGFWGPPMRLGTRSEITLLTLHRSESSA